MMMRAITLSVLLCLLVGVQSDNLQIGTSVNGQLAFTKDVQLSAIPFKIRTKSVFYNGNATIKGISAIDLSKTAATAMVTAGGVGSTFANMKMKSERGEPLNYQLQIFV
ncbi:uncharacterized protein LOC121731310 [Aricia agestis]|uniref:uncharacterized protein LOC121731310 n=1 Tax=Aricia agestis TaxID=91739 RepID=UPI001C208F11|nr:uncharacterized protein LOC121731310 [Aricia agestis]